MYELDEVKEIIAENLVRLRTKSNLTQAQLAEILNYSDKAVSKWERGESIPDIRVLMQIAGIYSVGLNDIVCRPQEREVKPVLNKRKKHLLITLLAFALVWFIATGIFVILFLVPNVEYEWISFVAAAFVSSIVLTVFSALWGTRVTNAITCSLILWSFAALLYILLYLFAAGMDNQWLIFVAASPFEVLIILWFILRKVK